MDEDAPGERRGEPGELGDSAGRARVNVLVVPRRAHGKLVVYLQNLSISQRTRVSAY